MSLLRHSFTLLLGFSLVTTVYCQVVLADDEADDGTDDWIQDLIDDQRSVANGAPAFIFKGANVVGHNPEDVPTFGGGDKPVLECQPPLFETCLETTEATRLEGQGTVWGHAYYGYDITGNLVQIDRVYGKWVGGQPTWLAQVENTRDANGKSCGCARTDHGCFAKGVKITMADGSLKDVETIAAGDMVKSPVNGAAVRVKQVIEGPELLPILEFAFGDQTIRVSQEHPMPIVRGRSQSGLSNVALSSAQQPQAGSQTKLVRANEVVAGDYVIGQDGKAKLVSSVRQLPVAFRQNVYNLELDAQSDRLEDHLLISNGLVTGDYRAQLNLTAQNVKKAN